MRDYSEPELAALEEAQRPAGTAEETPVLKRMSLETVQVPLLGRTKRSVLESLIEVAGRTWQIWEPATVLHAVLEREEILSTGFENGVAIPHPRNPLPDVLGQSVVAFGRTLSGIPFGARGGNCPTYSFWCSAATREPTSACWPGWAAYCKRPAFSTSSARPRPATPPTA